jgi:hypothetical protein
VQTSTPAHFFMRYRSRYCVPWVPFPPPPYHSFGNEIYILFSIRASCHSPLRFVSCVYISHRGPCPYTLSQIRGMWPA